MTILLRPLIPFERCVRIWSANDRYLALLRSIIKNWMQPSKATITAFQHEQGVEGVNIFLCQLEPLSCCLYPKVFARLKALNGYVMIVLKDYLWQNQSGGAFRLIKI